MGIRSLFAVLATCFTLALTASPANAQATRTWVSGVGDDVNPCSRTAPCKTFAGAISKTAAGGEINCLDPAGFGAVTITKSITIDCTGTLGGLLASSTTGVIVNGAGIIVALRGLAINGGPPNLPGVNGVRYLQGARVSIEDCVIFNFLAAAPNGHGILVNNASGTAILTVTNTTIRNNGTAVSGGGMGVQPTGTGVANVTLDNVRIQHNPNNGLFVSGAVTVMVANSNISFNAVNGIRTNAGAPTVRVGRSVITGNGTGISLAAGAIQSYCTNQLDGNGTDGAFLGACLPQD